MGLFSLCSGLAPDFYPDEVCRGNYSLHKYNPPLLYNLHNDPGEIYALNVKDYSNVMKQIDDVSHSISVTLLAMNHTTISLGNYTCYSQC